VSRFALRNLLRGRAALALAGVVGVILAATSASAYIRLTNGNIGLRFTGQTIPFTIHSSGSSDIADDSESAAVRLAFDAWAKIGTANLRFQEDASRAAGPKVHANDGTNMVMFDESNSTGLFTGASFVIAITPVFYDGNGGIIDSDVVFNGRDHAFGTDLAAGRYDVQNICTHEIGHFLGFDHTGVYGASLVPFAFPQDARMRSLAQDDRAAASAVYPGAASGQLSSFSGSIVRDATGRGINGAHVVAVNSVTGETEASAITNAGGAFTLDLIRAGSYLVYAEPLDGPCTDGNIQRNGVETGFWTTFYGGNEAPGVFSVAAGQRGASLGQLRVNELQEPFNIDGATPRSVARGTTVAIFLAGTGLAPGLEVEVTGAGVRVGENAAFPGRGVLGQSGSFTVSVDANATPGLRDIYVRKGTGQFRQVVALPGGFEVMDAAPRVTSVTPSVGNSAGGEPITIRGSSFRPGATVLLGDRIVSGVVVDGSGTSLTLTTPANAVGAVPVVVINPDGQESRLPAAFTYRGIPSILALSPTQGPSSGGVRVTLDGAQFASGAQVLFDGRAATSVVVMDGGTRLECVTPRGTSGVMADIAVVNPGTGGGSSTKVDAYRFMDPDLRTIDPAVGGTTGGTIVQLKGDGFGPGARVDFGSVRATRVDIVSQYELRATAPAGAAGTVGITIVTSDGRIDSLPGAFRYVAGADPVVSLVSPARGSTIGGESIGIYGRGFDIQPTVLIGGAPALSVTRISDAELTVTTPPGSTGAADVVVRGATGLQGRIFGGYTYDAPTSYGAPGGGGGGGGCAAAPGLRGAGAAGAIAPWLTLLAGLTMLRRRVRLRALLENR